MVSNVPSMDTDEMANLRGRVNTHLTAIWETPSQSLADHLIQAIGITDDHLSAQTAGEASPWTERDVALITYGDTMTGSEPTPLANLDRFLREHTPDVFGIVHILPFCPYSSDRGFSVIDYREVDPNLGTWADVARIGEHTDLMFDLVINHMSAESPWFAQFLAGEAPGRDFIYTADERFDTSSVVRPRSHPVLTSFDTASGPASVWTTFSADQVDLDWSNPALVAEMLSIIDLYISQGARLLRLDAIGYLWKRSGTSCIHLPETHEMIKLIHTLLEVRAPEVGLITETNVPDRENRSYFGDSDEAHLIYNFTLPPLTFDAVLSGRADRLAGWLSTTPAPPPGTTLFNFGASHDGIGVRPAEGILSSAEIDDLVSLTHERGGLHGDYDRQGVPAPYELNISMPDLFGGVDDPLMPDRILAFHAVVLAVAGVPAIYINSLLATTNDTAAVEADGVRRSINRGRIDLADVPTADSPAWKWRIFSGLTELIAIRRSSVAFHPDGAQHVTDLGGVLCIERTSPDGLATASVLVNLCDVTTTVNGRIPVEPYETRWEL